MNIKIYNCLHTRCDVFSDSIFTPIHVGRSVSSICLDTLGDDTGENISAKNPFYCELTAQYWAWKNDKKSDWIGLVHYRRYMDFCKNNEAIDRFGHIEIDSINDNLRAKYGLNETSVKKIIEDNPGLVAIMPKKWDVRNVGFKNILDHYAKSDFHFLKDILLVKDAINSKHPEYSACLDRFLDSNKGYFNNIFVMRRDAFEGYCSWLFDILFEVENDLTMVNYSKGAKRVFGYLSERLINVYLEKNFGDDEKKIVNLDRIFVKSVNKKIATIDPLEENTVSIVTASDNKFVPHLAALIASIQSNFKSQNELDIIILDGGISPSNRNLLCRQFYSDGDGRISFVDCSNMYRDLNVHMHFSVPTYYRLSLSEILPNYKKILYLDADLIVLSDISELYDISLADSEVIAAVPDVVMKHFVAKDIPAFAGTGGQKAKQYLQEWVGMGNSYDSYFQAGVMLIDLDKFRSMHIYSRSYNELKNKSYWFVDQDVLNKLLIGSVKMLDLSWNVLNESMKIVNDLEKDLKYKIKECFELPKIIHYAGNDSKPWKNDGAPLSQYYWYYLRRTIWYEEVRHKKRSRIFCMFSMFLSGINKRILYLMMQSWRALPNIVQIKFIWLRNILVNED